MKATQLPVERAKPEPTPECRFNWYQQYDDQRDAIDRAQSNIYSAGESMTQAHFAEDADINVMVRRFGITDGAVPPMALDPAYFGDYTEAPTSLREAHDRVFEAQNRFNQLPAPIRSKFGNDYRQLSEWITQPNNHDEAVKLGLLKRVYEPEKPPAEPAEKTP